VSFIDYFKAAYDLASKAQSVDLQRELMAMREDYNTLHEENLNLRGRVKALEEQLAVKGALVFRDPAYYLTHDDGREDGPFCQRCWDVDRRVVRVRLVEVVGGHWAGVCKQCNLEHSRKSG
jgi:hypothetical protein